jgi:predicted dehydrogenase/nucleoside-diphosphate-sugar epimerase
MRTNVISSYMDLQVLSEADRRLRLAVVGCGAISRDFHLPVLAGHDGVTIAALVDRDTVRAGELARAYGVPRVLADAKELDLATVDAALVASPPFHHAPCTIDLANKGIHVLVEKPMALTRADAEAMVKAAERTGVVLAVGLFRRLFPSMRLLKSLIASGHLGRPVGFDIEAGSVYGWPLTTLANLRKDQGGGGVFLDIAPHTLDQLLYVLPGDLKLAEYRDNARGGIESDCELRFGIRTTDGTVIPGRMELSRTRKLRNTIRIDCERGSFELSSGERFQVGIKLKGLELADDPGGARAYQLQAKWEGEPDVPGFAAYREQLDDFLGAIRAKRKPRLSGESAVPVVGFIEECYRSVKPMSEPWVEEGLVAATPKSPGRVLVTGATGFIGGRVAELLALKDGWQVRALVRQPGSASRLARLPVEMVLGDLGQPKELARAVADCDAVVHCAIGTAYGNRKEIFEVTVEGTRRLAAAAKAAGVRRFVHVSTMAVHGKEAIGVLDESSPVRPSRGDDYAESKIEAERLIERAVRDGLPATILRLANVYGPFGATLTTRPIQHLLKGTLAIVGGDKKPCNMVYVDNVADAIAKALTAAPDSAVGETFAISDGERMTWLEFFSRFAEEFGVAPPSTPSTGPASPIVSRGPLAWGGSWVRGWKDVLTSSEAKSFAKRLLQADPVGRLPRRIVEAPMVNRRLRRWMKADRPLVYVPTSADEGGRMTMNPIAAYVDPAKARTRLGFGSPVQFDVAAELTIQWLRNTRLSSTTGSR